MNKKVVEAINASPYKAYVTVTGGGTSFIGDFLGFGGGSSTILGFNVPYATEEFVEFIGKAPDKFVSPDAARKLAVASFERAVKNVDRENAIGIGCTASLKKENERVGRKHFVFVAYHTAYLTGTVQIEFKESVYGRDFQETVSSTAIYLALAEACGFEINWKDNLLVEFLHCEINRFEFPEVSEKLFSKDNWVLCNPFAHNLLEEKDLVLFPGSFNPLHHGHMKVYEFVKTFLGVTPVFELSVTNVDKPALSYYDIVERWKNMADLPLILTNAPRMIDKIHLFRKGGDSIKSAYLTKNLTIVMGLDTWDRFARLPYDTEKDIEDIKRYINLKFVVSNRPASQTCFSEKYGIKSTFIPGLNIEASSSQIRKERV